MTNRPVNNFEKYHAHVYFDSDSVEFATSLCLEAGKLFGVEVGRIHQKPIGPHPRWSCQLAFDRQLFDRLIPWLDSKRGELTVFVHPLTGDDLEDHSTYAAWLGDEVQLNLWVFGVDGLIRETSPPE
ncbi:MAG: DOPA 4,5-dioxygenase family protein [Cyanobacteria bacterium J06639_1]